MSKLAEKFFNYRSYTPIPFLIVMVIFQNVTLVSLIGGFAICLIGESFRLWGVSVAGSETRTTGKVGGTFLVVTGAFGYLRNPLYLGNILLYLGIGIMSNALFPYLQIGAFIFFYVQYRLIISEEENYLRNTFGEKYEMYFKSVPRLIPSLKKYKSVETEQPSYDLMKGLKSEVRSLQAFAAVSIILIIFYLVKL